MIAITTHDLQDIAGFRAVCLSEEPRAVTSAYCCDLLSLVMGRAPEGCAWVTVMGNLNAVAVAVLADIAAVIVAEGMPLDAGVEERARERGVALFLTDLPVFEAAKQVESRLHAED